MLRLSSGFYLFRDFPTMFTYSVVKLGTNLPPRENPQIQGLSKNNQANKQK